MTPITFELTDHAGRSHAYHSGYLAAEEGLDIALRLIAVGAEPFAALLGNDAGAMKAALGDGGAALGATVDVKALATQVRSTLLALPRGEGVALIRRIMAPAARDGRALANAADFDAAYRGNYAELFSAAWKLIAANRLFPGLAT